MAHAWISVSASPDEDDFSEICKLIKELINEFITKVVIRARGAERHQDGAIWRPLQGNYIFIDLVSCLRIHLQDVHIYYCYHRPTERKNKTWERQEFTVEVFLLLITNITPKLPVVILGLQKNHDKLPVV